MKKLFLVTLAFGCLFLGNAQTIYKNGGLSAEQVSKLQSSFKSDNSTKALRNAVVTNDINKLAKNYDNHGAFDARFERSRRGLFLH